MARSDAAKAYEEQGHDAVRRAFEEPLLGRELEALLHAAGGGALLDLGCGDGLARRLAGRRLRRYLGIDLAPPAAGDFLAHDLRDGLGPVGRRSFDVYLGSFGLASHLSPATLRGLLREIASHARPGALVALEALGLRSLEWPGVWNAPPGPARLLPYRLAADVSVHPWAPAELAGLFGDAGIEPISARDRTLQCPPKAGESRYWPGMPALRRAMNELLAGAEPAPALVSPLPPLPAGDAAVLHHALAARRRELLAGRDVRGAALARSVWRLEPATAGGYGHGLLVVGRVR